MPASVVPARPALLDPARLLELSADAALDRLTRLATRLVDAPAAMLSLVDGGRWRVLSATSAAPAGAGTELPPTTATLCRTVVAGGRPLVVADVRDPAVVARHEAAVACAAAGFVSYLGVPVLLGGRAVGTLCALDRSPRQWTPGDVTALADLAAAASAELELRQLRATATLAEERTRLLVDGVDAIVWEADPFSFLFTFVSQRAESLLGYPLAQWYTDPTFWVNLIHPDDRDEAVTCCVEATRAKRDHDFEYRVVTASGEVRWLRDIVALVLDETGEPYRLRGVMIDITEQKRAEAALRRSEARLAEAQRIGRIGSWEWDVTGQRVSASVELLRLFGLDAETATPPAEVRFDTLIDRVHADDRASVRGALAAAIAAAQPSDVEFRVVLPDRSARWLHSRFTPLPGEDGAAQRWAGTTQDVTEPRELELQLRHSQRMEAVGQLASGIAHDFNNLLAAILANVELLQSDLPEACAAAEDAAAIRHAASRAAGLTAQLLAFSRKQVLTPSLVEVNEVVRDTGAMLRRLVERDVELAIALDDDVGAVSADPGQLSQVLVNLVLNARDALGGTGRIAVRTSEATLRRGHRRWWPWLNPGRFVELVVEDTGCGMDDETRERAFEPFFTTKPMGSGTGLGLATVYGIVRQSGGAVRIESEVGRGTRVSVFLPIAAGATSADAGLPTTATAAAAAAMPRPVAPAGTPPVSRPAAGADARPPILVVDDEPAVRTSVRRLLERSGHRVLEAHDGEAALRAAQSVGGRIALVLTDVMMPGLDGPSTVARLHALYPGLPVVYMSGRVDLAVPLSDGPAARFLAKPFDAATLVDTVARSLAADAAA